MDTYGESGTALPKVEPANCVGPNFFWNTTSSALPARSIAPLRPRGNSSPVYVPLTGVTLRPYARGATNWNAG